MKFRLIEDGNFSGVLRASFVVVGALLIVLPTLYVDASALWLVLVFVGLLLMAIGGFASRAHMLNIKPFDNSYKKARKTYEKEDGGK